MNFILKFPAKRKTPPAPHVHGHPQNPPAISPLLGEEKARQEAAGKQGLKQQLRQSRHKIILKGKFNIIQHGVKEKSSFGAPLQPRITATVKLAQSRPAKRTFGY
ncbi:MAG: hypothetical protein HY751_13040 [Nitrospinae bacterium]|nr:hypothetical protein [Nitrospinota bacterium]